MEIPSLFPIPLGSFQLGRKPLPSEIEWVQSQPTRVNEANSTSCSSRILDEPELSGIRIFIEESLNSFLKRVYNLKKEIRLRITQSWCNYSACGQSHPQAQPRQ